MADLEVKHQDVSIKEVIDYFVKGFEFTGDKQIVSYDYFYDPQQGRVIFRLYLKENEFVNQAQGEQALAESRPKLQAARPHFHLEIRNGLPTSTCCQLDPCPKSSPLVDQRATDLA